MNFFLHFWVFVLIGTVKIIMFGMLVICMEWIDVVVWGIDG
jgi:hypothetical protein